MPSPLIVIAHPDPRFREEIRSYLRASQARLEVRAEPEECSGTSVLIVPVSMVPGSLGLVVRREVRVLALVNPGELHPDRLRRCDDFLLLPFDPLELRVRVERLLARVPTLGWPDAAIEIGEVRLDSDAQRVWFQGRELELTRREFELLEVLMRNAGRILPKGELLRAAWGAGFSGKPRTVDQHVLQVRQRLGDHARDSRYIVTVHGRGYMFVNQPRTNSGVLTGVTTAC
jgi:DNA-binding response OmpR family regulator